MRSVICRYNHTCFVFCALGGSASAAEEGARGVREVREGPAEGVSRRAPPPPQLKRVAHHGGVDPSHQVSAGLYAPLHARDTPTKQTYTTGRRVLRPTPCGAPPEKLNVAQTLESCYLHVAVVAVVHVAKYFQCLFGGVFEYIYICGTQMFTSIAT